LRGGALPPALLCAAIGLALSFAPRSAWLPSVVTLTTTTFALAALPISRDWLEGVFLGCWASVAATAAGAELALTGSRLDIAKALVCVLLLFPAGFIVGWRAPIIVKVVSSWLIAVAILAATLQFLPVTPGYLPDHLD
jgi:hypothetical protein